MANAETKNVTILSLDEMLDTEMNSVETLPDFVTPPPGTYVLTVTECAIEKYKPKAKPGQAAPAEMSRIRQTYKVDQTIEVVAGELPIADGSLFSETFMGTEEGLKYFKKSAMGVLNVKDLGDAKLRDVIDGVKGQSFKARITIRKTAKEDGTGHYENVQIRPAHETPAA